LIILLISYFCNPIVLKNKYCNQALNLYYGRSAGTQSDKY
jgi:hypothetical protein